MVSEIHVYDPYIHDAAVLGPRLRRGNDGIIDPQRASVTTLLLRFVVFSQDTRSSADMCIARDDDNARVRTAGSM